MKTIKYKISENYFKENKVISFNIHLDSDVREVGLTRLWFKSELPGSADLQPANIHITGETTSKYNFIKNSFNGGNVVVNQEIALKNSFLTGKVIQINNQIKQYIIGVNTPSPIEYIDYNSGRTIFSYYVKPDNTSNTQDVYGIEYFNLIQEPKITSEIFIDRGVNSVFDGIKRLKTINNLTELEKTGFNFFNINKKGEKNNY